MADFANKDSDKFYHKELADETRYYKHDEKGVRRMCKIMEDIRNEGAKERSEQMALNMLADGKLSKDFCLWGDYFRCKIIFDAP